ncbi:hypothetical protein [Schaalia sp. 19OD2882]|uniref:hypothetical protein n=1 Tax=Schaalia sp. 19OD2882 TaxID=2794089 RepID=UPI0020A80BE2|nr:hypothetical protein [Schaalia sp. 19OD2882]
MRRHWMLVVAALLLPSLLSLTIVVGAGRGNDALACVPAAIVNSDTIATLPDGTKLPGGRQIIAALTKNDGSSTRAHPAHDHVLDWSVVSADTAAAGLVDGSYAAVVTIPDGFSQSLVDVLQGTGTTAPSLDVHTSSTATTATGFIAAELASAAAESFGTTLTVNFLSQSLSRTGQIADGFTRAAEGADRLASGQTAAAAGARTFAQGLSDARNGAGTLADGVTAYVNGVSRVSDGVGQLAGGAAALASGADQAAGGSSRLSEGAGTLSGGAETLAEGTAAFAGGVHQYTQGVAQLAAGLNEAQPGQTRSLVDGAVELAEGVRSYTGGVAQVHSALTEPAPGQEVSLQEGAHLVAGGTSQIADLVDSIDPKRLHSLVDRLYESRALVAAWLDRVVNELDPLVDRCLDGDDNACEEADALAAELHEAARKYLHSYEEDIAHLEKLAEMVPKLGDSADKVRELAAGSEQVASGIDQVATGIETNLMGANAEALNAGPSGLARGLGQVGQGANALAANGSQLAAGADEVAQGSGQLAAGAHTLAGGVALASQGSGALAEGIQQLASGTAAAADGARSAADAGSALSRGAHDFVGGAGQLSEGAQRISGGLQALADGSQSLAAGLRQASAQVPVHTPEQASALADAIATPVTVKTTSPTAPTSSEWAPAAIVVALWLSALVWVLAFGQLTAARIGSATTPAQLAVRTLAPLVGVGALAAAIMVAAVRVAGTPMANLWAVFAVSIVLAVALVALHQALVAAFGQRTMALVSCVALVAQAVSLSVLFPGAPQDGAFALVRAFLPLPVAEDALTSLMAGGSLTGAAGLVATALAWTVACVAVTVAAISRRRHTSVAQLRAQLS